MKNNVSVRLLRHATVVVEIGGVKFLADPLLADKEAYEAVKGADNENRYPMTALPFDETELNKILNEVDAVLVTHTHRDHWDDVAQQLIDKDKPLFVQPADLDKIREQGFRNVTVVNDHTTFKGIKLSRTGGQHGTGEIGKKMGIVSGFVLSDSNTTVYIAGDTIWCEEVADALKTYKPDITIVNGGAPQYLTGDPITMTPEDMVEVYAHSPATKIIAVHMEVVNHAKVDRAQLRNRLATMGYEDKVLIPADGETLRF